MPRQGERHRDLLVQASRGLSAATPTTMSAMPAYWIGVIVSPKSHNDPATIPMRVRAVTGKASLSFARRRTIIQRPKVRMRHATANQARQDCATMAIQATVGVGFARWVAAALKRSWAALSDTTRPIHSSANERRDPDVGVLDIGLKRWS